MYRQITNGIHSASTIEINVVTTFEAAEIIRIFDNFRTRKTTQIARSKISSNVPKKDQIIHFSEQKTVVVNLKDIDVVYYEQPKMKRRNNIFAVVGF